MEAMVVPQENNVIPIARGIGHYVALLSRQEGPWRETWMDHLNTSTQIRSKELGRQQELD